MGVTKIVKALVSPAEKLIDNITAAIGKVYEPHYIKKIAEAESYKIRQITSAMRDNCDMPIVYDKNGISQIDISDYDALIKRAGARAAFQEINKQKNIETVVNNAYHMLEESEPVSNVPVDTGWIMRFMNSVEDINDSDLQVLWAKILAGEVKKPNTYSLRTLAVLKNLSKNEAELFQSISPFIINDDIICINKINNDSIFNKYNIKYNDILLLDDCGLINSSGTVTSNITINDEIRHIIHNGNYLLAAKCNNNHSDNISYKIYPLTEAGKGIHSIISANPNDEFFFDVCRSIVKSNKNISFSFHRISAINGDEVEYDTNNLISILGIDE